MKPRLRRCLRGGAGSTTARRRIFLVGKDATFLLDDLDNSVAGSGTCPVLRSPDIQIVEPASYSNADLWGIPLGVAQRDSLLRAKSGERTQPSDTSTVQDSVVLHRVWKWQKEVAVEGVTQTQRPMQPSRAAVPLPVLPPKLRATCACLGVAAVGRPPRPAFSPSALLRECAARTQDPSRHEVSLYTLQGGDGARVVTSDEPNTTALMAHRFTDSTVGEAAHPGASTTCTTCTCADAINCHPAPARRRCATIKRTQRHNPFRVTPDKRSDAWLHTAGTSCHA